MRLLSWLSGIARAARGSLRQRDVDTGLEDGIGELFRVSQPAQCIDRQLVLLPLGNRLLADLARGDLKVLLADRRHHVHGAQVERGKLVGVKPGSQTVIALADVVDAGDAGQPSQLVLEVDCRIVAEKDVVVPAVG